MRKKKFYTFEVYLVRSLWAPDFVKGQVQKSMIFHFGTLQNRNGRQHMNVFAKFIKSFRIIGNTMYY